MTGLSHTWRGSAVTTDSCKGTEVERATPAHWDSVCAQLQSELGEEVFSSWFSAVRFIGESDGCLQISVPTRFLKQWIETNYGEKLLKYWRVYYPEIKGITFLLRSYVLQTTEKCPKASFLSATQNLSFLSKEEESQDLTRGVKKSSSQEFQKQETASQNSPGLLKKKTPKPWGGGRLDPRYTFDSFVEGPSNGLAVAAIRQLIRAPIVTFNPLYLHAAVGLGKTHLMHAVGTEFLKKGRQILYLTAEHFVYKFVSAMFRNSTLLFKEKFQELDLFLVDDMQFLQGKRVQQEFCHTINQLMDAGKQVIIASDRTPSEFGELDERTRSRLDGGLTIGIEEFDRGLRLRILRKRLALMQNQYRNLFVPDEVLDYIADHITSNGRDLEGALNRLAAYSQFSGMAVGIEMAQRSLQDLTRSDGTTGRVLKIEEIQHVVAQHYNLNPCELVSHRRTRNVVHPRQIAIYLSKIMTTRSLPEIGRRFGNRDHSTILHSVRQIEKELTTNKQLVEEVELLRRRLAST